MVSQSWRQVPLVPPCVGKCLIGSRLCHDSVVATTTMCTQWANQQPQKTTAENTHPRNIIWVTCSEKLNIHNVFLCENNGFCKHETPFVFPKGCFFFHFCFCSIFLTLHIFVFCFCEWYTTRDWSANTHYYIILKSPVIGNNMEKNVDIQLHSVIAVFLHWPFSALFYLCGVSSRTTSFPKTMKIIAVFWKRQKSKLSCRNLVS